MLFNSLAYAVFLPAVLAGYFFLPQRLRILWLLAASCLFYMVYRPKYILILAVLITIDYFAARCIAAVPLGRSRRFFLWISIAATCLTLLIFKYFNFAAGSLSAVTALVGLHFKPHLLWLALPIGLSFHTFQSLSYVIEVYRGKQPAERNFLVYASYVMFFPQLVAGPIERPQNLLHQFRERHSFDPARASAGIKRIAWGLFKKAVIADRLALVVGDVFDSPEKYGGVYLTIAAVAFTYQIYCDFSGYTDIALGSAQLLGFRLVENFDAPFCSRSIGEFWRRWHISLSNWFRDYVYIPLGGSRGSWFVTIRNLLFTFTLSGLWHGAGWNYIVWGALNGTYLVCGRITHPWRRRLAARLRISEGNPLRAGISVLLTFAFTCVAFVFFRANSVSRSWYILAHICRNYRLPAVFATPHLDQFQLGIACAAIILLEAVQWVRRHPSALAVFAEAPAQFRWASYLALASVVALFGVYLDGAFIYFQF
jgi:D-alanyl-lipoteichoic acid acyltransferase DltB (MBOAT superfamily)